MNMPLVLCVTAYKTYCTVCSRIPMSQPFTLLSQNNGHSSFLPLGGRKIPVKQTHVIDLFQQ